jgi:hypothetical protein
MFGLFGLLGRSRELQQLDRGVRAAGLHPRLMPEAVKLTAVKLVKEAHGATELPVEACEAAARLLAYCMLGAAAFTEANDAALTQAVEARLVAALDAGDSLDARLVLLALHAGTIEPGVMERYRLESV